MNKSHEVLPGFPGQDFSFSDSTSSMDKTDDQRLAGSMAEQTLIEQEHAQFEFERSPSFEELQNIDIGDLHGDVMAAIEVLERAGLIKELSLADSQNLKRLLTWNKMDQQAKLELMEQCLSKSDPIAEFNAAWPVKQRELIENLNELRGKSEEAAQIANLLNQPPGRLIYLFLARKIELKDGVEQKLRQQGRDLAVTSLGDIFNKDSFGLQILLLLKMVKDRAPDVLQFKVLLGNHDHRVVSALGTRAENQKDLLAILSDVMKYGDVAYGESLFTTAGLEDKNHGSDRSLGAVKQIGGIDLEDWPELKRYFKTPGAKVPETILAKYGQRLRTNLLTPGRIRTGFSGSEKQLGQISSSTERQSIFAEIMRETKIVDYDPDLGILRFHGDPTEQQAEYILDVCRQVEQMTDIDQSEIFSLAIQRINQEYQEINQRALESSDKPVISDSVWKNFNDKFHDSYQYFILGSNAKRTKKLSPVTAAKLAALGVRLISHGHISNPDGASAFVKAIGPLAVVNGDVSMSSGTRGKRAKPDMAGAWNYYHNKRVREGYSGIDSKGVLRVYIEEEVSTDSKNNDGNQTKRSQSCLYFPLVGMEVTSPESAQGQLRLRGRDSSSINLIFEDKEGVPYELSPEKLEILTGLYGAAVRYDFLPIVSDFPQDGPTLRTLNYVSEGLINIDAKQQFDDLRNYQEQLDRATRLVVYQAISGEVRGVFGGSFAEIYSSKQAALGRAEYLSEINYLTETHVGKLKTFGVYVLPDYRYMITNVKPFEINLATDKKLQQLLEELSFAEQFTIDAKKALMQFFEKLGIEKNNLVTEKGVLPQAVLPGTADQYSVEKLGDIITDPVKFASQTRNEKSKQLAFVLQQALVKQNIPATVRLALFARPGRPITHPDPTDKTKEFRYVVELPVLPGQTTEPTLVDPTEPTSWLPAGALGSFQTPYTNSIHFYNDNNLWTSAEVPPFLTDAE